ncbi:MAG: MBL fold metallo-hydrolase, partial [Pseudomonadota bacterium]
MIFEQIADGGCRSYIVGCADACVAALIDPAQRQIDRYAALAAKRGLRIADIVETHTHADHFTGARTAAERFGAPIVMHRDAPAPFVDLRLDDGDSLRIGALRMTAMHTPGHTADSMSFLAGDRVFTGDTLLIKATGRTDLPTGDPNALYDSLFGRLLKLDPATIVHPAHEYKGREATTIGKELAENPRLSVRDRGDFVAMMNRLNLSAPTHLTEALRVNMTGGASVAQLLSEAAADVPFLSLDALRQWSEERRNDVVILDVRERDSFEDGHVPGARHLPRGLLELKVNEAFPDPTVRIVTYCDFGRISTLAAATLRRMGFQRVSALDGGMIDWRERGFDVETGA